MRNYILLYAIKCEIVLSVYRIFFHYCEIFNTTSWETNWIS